MKRNGLLSISILMLAVNSYAGSWVSSGNNTYYSGGNVGIGVTASKAYGPEWMQGGLTIGSATNYNGVNHWDMTDDLVPYAFHEFGHTVQFIGLSGIAGALNGNNDNTWQAYIGLGGTGTIWTSGFWETGASKSGAVVWGLIF